MQRFKVVIIGTGFGGLATAIRLLRRGTTDFHLLERRDFMGGTWCQNSYPGAAVDVHSPLYALSTEPWVWSQMFASRDELTAYTTAIIDKYGLRARTTLNADVQEVRWDDARSCWQITTASAGVFEAQVVVNASGPLSKPVVPDLPGRDTFAGAAFHTNAWDHAVDLRGKRVAVVGSGASAAQVIPAIAGQVSALHVFQRTPHWVLPRHDHTFSPLERRLLRLTPLQQLLRWSLYWRLETRVIGFKYSPWALHQLAQRPALAHLAAQVPDPVLRAKLTPDYTIGCKRILLSNTLYPTLGLPHVTLHDKHDAIEEITPTGARTPAGHVDLDVIVWATGYDATDAVISYPVVGRGGQTLADFWRAYPRAYLGTAVPDFPNLFILTGPNTGIGHTSALFIIEAQLEYVDACLARLESTGAASVEVRADAEAAWTDQIHREMARTVWQSGGCKSWYQSKSGHVVAMFPGFSFTFLRLAQTFRPEHHALRGAA